MFIKHLKPSINALLIYFLCTSVTWADINIWMYPIFGENITRIKMRWLTDELSEITNEDVTMHFSSNWEQMLQLSNEQKFDIILAGKTDLPNAVTSEYHYRQFLQASLNPILYSKQPLNEIKTIGYPLKTAFEEIAHANFSHLDIRGYVTPTEMVRAFLTGEVPAILINKSHMELFPANVKKSAEIVSIFPGKSKSVVLFSQSFQQSKNAEKFINYYLEGSAASKYFYQEIMGFTPWKKNLGEAN